MTKESITVIRHPSDMRIIFIAAKLNIVTGGGAHYGLDVKLRTLQSFGHTVTLITLFQGENRFPPQGPPYKVIEEPSHDRRFRMMQRQVADLLKKYEADADAFYIDGVSFIWAGGMYRKHGGRVPTVAYLSTYIFAQNLLTPELPDYQRFPLAFAREYIKYYTHFFKHRLWANFVGLDLIRHLDQIYAISPLAKDLYAHLGFPADKMMVIPEFVDVTPYSPPQNEVRPTAFVKERPMKLMYSGRLLYMKGLDRLLLIIRDLISEGLHLHLDIVGDGPQKPMLERLIARLGLERHITFHDWTSSAGLAAHYRACDIFIHPCRLPEPFGRTILEAMACGRPIVTSHWTGSAWIAADGGLTYRHGDWEDLKRVLRTCHASPTLLKEKSNAALKRVPYFDHRAWARTLENSLKALAQI